VTEDVFDKLEALTGTREIPADLPNIYHRDFRELRYDLRRYERGLFQVERWWWKQVTKIWDNLRRQALRRDIHWIPDGKQFVLTAEIAMFWATALGLLSAAQQIASAAAMYDFSVPVTSALVAMAEPGDTIDPAVEFLKDAILIDPPDETFLLYEQRLPPIRHATTQICEAVRDTTVLAISAQWSDKQFEERLQAVGRWPLARIRNQIRTETATMFNAGRFTRMHTDPAVAGYKYIVTVDDRTTPICRALIDKKVKKEDLHAIPPLHYQCRTVLDCVYAWQNVNFDSPHDLPEPGKGDFMQFAGFGQQAVVDTTPGAPPPKIRPRRRRRKPRRPTAAENKQIPFREASATFDKSDFEKSWMFWEKEIDKFPFNPSVAAKEEVEERLVKRLSRSKVFRDFMNSEVGGLFANCSPSLSPERINKVVAGLVQQWSATAADEWPWAMALQIAAQEEFGLTWAMTEHFHTASLIEGQKIYQTYGAALRTFLRAMYQETQQFLADAGIDELLLFRGIRKRPKHIGLAPCKCQPMNSWTVRPRVARTFGGTSGTIMAARIPREYILSTVRTGFGCFDEYEFVVLSPQGTITQGETTSADLLDKMIKISQQGA